MEWRVLHPFLYFKDIPRRISWLIYFHTLWWDFKWIFCLILYRVRELKKNIFNQVTNWLKNILRSNPTTLNACIIIATIYFSLWKYFNVILFHDDVQLAHNDILVEIFIKYKYILDKKELSIKLTVFWMHGKYAGREFNTNNYTS